MTLILGGHLPSEGIGKKTASSLGFIRQDLKLEKLFLKSPESCRQSSANRELGKWYSLSYRSVNRVCFGLQTYWLVSHEAS